VELALGQYDTYCSAASRVAQITYDAGLTATSFGIANATQQFKTRGRPASMAVPKVMVVLTDGQSTRGCQLPGVSNDHPCHSAATVSAADQARRAGITVMVVSIGSINTLPAANAEMTGIVGDDARLRFAVANYSSLLGQFVATLQAAGCSQAARVDQATLVNRTLGVNETIYLRYDNLNSTTNDVERDNRGFRRRQNAHYRLRDKRSIQVMLDRRLLRDGPPQGGAKLKKRFGRPRLPPLTTQIPETKTA
jgi:hypothetical protein